MEHSWDCCGHSTPLSLNRFVSRTIQLSRAGCPGMLLAASAASGSPASGRLECSVGAVQRNVKVLLS